MFVIKHFLISNLAVFCVRFKIYDNNIISVEKLSWGCEILIKQD
jgi:hypothetical protein